MLFLPVALKADSSICNCKGPGLQSHSDLNVVLICYLGTFKGPSDSRCRACRTGEYQLQRGKESCDLCPESHYCPVSPHQLGQPVLATAVPWQDKYTSINTFLFFL